LGEGGTFKKEERPEKRAGLYSRESPYKEFQLPNQRFHVVGSHRPNTVELVGREKTLWGGDRGTSI